MCNHSYIGRVSCTGRQVAASSLAARSRIFFWQALVLFIAFRWPLAAQFPNAPSFGWHVDEFEAMANHLDAGETEIGYLKRASRRPPAEAKVSADELRHPLTEKARRVLAKAWGYAKKGDHSRAITTLQEGMSKVRAVVPYAHEMLGIEYMRTDRDAEAVPEFAEAASFFPRDASVHSNLALALCVVGRFDSAEQEARMALYLDPTLQPAQEIARLIERSKARLTRSD
ncbi:MAG: hypothetical protein ABSB15_27085 [Bryobacteraceae bacterium]|jgi:tetratricopeptide (TPR) repeat protein